MATKKNNTIPAGTIDEEAEKIVPTEAMNLEAENAALKAELEALKIKQAALNDASGPAVMKLTWEPKGTDKPVKIRIPRTKKDEEDVFVSVNNYTCIIKRGVEVEVPEYVAEVLQHQEEMLEEIMLFEDAVQNKHK